MGALALPYLDIMGSKTLAARRGRVIRRDWRVFISRAPSIITTGFRKTPAQLHAGTVARPLASIAKIFPYSPVLHIQGRISGHEHPYNWLTGTNIKQTPGTVTNTISMDQVAAKYAGPTYVRSLALSFANGVGTTTLSRNAMGADIPATADYQAVFNRLFPPADKAQIQEAKKRIALDRSVLDTAVGDIKRFQGSSVKPIASVWSSTSPPSVRWNSVQARVIFSMKAGRSLTRKACGWSPR